MNSDVLENELIEGSLLLEPNMEVSKIGRSTGATTGIVNSCIVQQWADDKYTAEIGVLGENGGLFGDVGDSGSLVFTKHRDKVYGVGMLIGKNYARNFGLVSPLWAILEDVQDELGQEINLEFGDYCNKGE